MPVKITFETEFKMSEIVADVWNDDDFIGFFHSEAWRRCKALLGIDGQKAWEAFNRVYDDTMEALECQREAEIEAAWPQVAW